MSYRDVEGYRAALRKKIKARSSVAENGCWEWRGKLAKQTARDASANPVPRLRSAAQSLGYDFYQATIASWFAFKGGLPNGCVARSCRNHLCVNPDHLELVDRVQVGRIGGTKAGKQSRPRNRLCNWNMLDDALRIHEGNVALAAEWLGVTEHSIRMQLTARKVSVKVYQGAS